LRRTIDRGTEENPKLRQLENWLFQDDNVMDVGPTPSASDSKEQR
jgi:hypothetical protein